MISLVGPLGAGKTTLVRGFVSRFGGSGVSSPSYTIAQSYATDPPIHHLDFYRLNDPEDALQLGLEEYFTPEAICLVEWGDRFPELLPKNHLTLRISILSSEARRMTLLS